MKKETKYLLRYIVFVAAVLPSKAAAQPDKEYPGITTEIMEELVMDMEDSGSSVLMMEALQELIDDPVMINSLKEKELSRLFFLTEYQVKSLIHYTSTTGKIVSYYEIAYIPGFDRSTAEMMIPCVTLEEIANSEDQRKRLRTEILTNIIFKPGEADTSKLGSYISEKTRIRITANKIEAGTTFEKDAGERFFPEGKLKPDYLSAYLSYTGTGILKKLIIGDYSAKFGQGININTNFATSLSIPSSNLISGKDEIKHYRSTDENNFFRGLAAGFSAGDLSATLLLSRNNIDATLITDEETGELQVKNLYTSGIHDSWTSLNKKDVLTKSVLGVNLEYDLNSVKVGATWSGTSFSIPFADQSEDIASTFNFSGERVSVYSLHYKSTFDRIMAFGEISSNNFRSFALVQGVTIRAADRLSANILYRNYQPAYTTFNGRAPGASSISSNEEGIFGNLFFELYKNLFLTAGADIYRSEWVSYRSSFPKRSLKEEIRLKYQPTESATIEISYSKRYSEVNSEEAVAVPSKEAAVLRSVRINGTYLTDYGITLKSRLEYKRAKPSGSTGILLLQDINYSFSKIPVSFWFRYSVFNTGSWESRLYCYENDLLYGFSVPALSGTGSRSYIMLKYSIGRYTDLRIKYAVTSIVEPDNGTNDSDQLKFQIKISW